MTEITVLPLEPGAAAVCDFTDELLSRIGR